MFSRGAQGAGRNTERIGQAILIHAQGHGINSGALPSSDACSLIWQAWPFPIESESDQELIAGFDDKNLEFRVSVLSIDGRVYLATWVHPHNIAGRMYLTIILQFHVLVARDALGRVSADSKLRRADA